MGERFLPSFIRPWARGGEGEGGGRQRTLPLPTHTSTTLSQPRRVHIAIIFIAKPKSLPRGTSRIACYCNHCYCCPTSLLWRRCVLLAWLAHYARRTAAAGGREMFWPCSYPGCSFAQSRRGAGRHSCFFLFFFLLLNMHLLLPVRVQ